MVVPHAHLIRLERSGRRVIRIVTNQGSVDVPYQGKVFLALGTIENTRLALETVPNQRGLIGKNLMAHLRSNLTIRIPKSSLSPAVRAIKELAVSALFVKGIHQHTDSTLGHFHLQLTASGVGALGMNSEAELFKKIPNIDELDRFNDLTDDWIVISSVQLTTKVGRAGWSMIRIRRLRMISGNFMNLTICMHSGRVSCRPWARLIRCFRVWLFPAGPVTG